MLELYLMCPSFFITWFSPYVWGICRSSPTQECGTNGRGRIYGKCFYYKPILACFTKFEFITLVSSKSTDKLDVIPCSLVYRYEYFGGKCCLHLQTRSIFLQNVVNLFKKTAQYHISEKHKSFILKSVH